MKAPQAPRTLTTLLPTRILNEGILQIDASTPPEVQFNIFKRINTGGNTLNDQEIRHCMSSKRSRTLLKSCAASSTFLEVTNHALENHPRMADREVVLRFCAFRMLENINEYDITKESFDAFLAKAVKKLDYDLPNEYLRVLEVDFERAMKNALLLFGRHAFRKWPLGEDRTYPFNRALFESWAVNLANYEWQDLALRKDAIVHEARRGMRDDENYIESISIATNHNKKVELRFNKARLILEEVGR